MTEPETTDAEAAEAETPAPPTSDRAQDLRLVEALLFAASAPIDEAALALRFPEGTDVAGLLAELEELYRARGVHVVRIAGGWTLRTAPDLAPRLNLEKTVTRKLSRAAVETLAIIAYHQPVTRGEVEEIRGVALGKGTLDALIESGWIKPKGRRQTPGRPVTWVTTEAFLAQFGLDSLGDLPGVDELKAAGLLDARPAASLGDTEPPTESDEPPDSDAEALAEEMAAEAAERAESEAAEAERQEH
jgi:segregation and condensation protein B